MAQALVAFGRLASPWNCHRVLANIHSLANRLVVGRAPRLARHRSGLACQLELVAFQVSLLSCKREAGGQPMSQLFPGMDPYLEDPAFWADFHLTFIGCWREAIADQLPETYEARLDETIHLVQM